MIFTRKKLLWEQENCCCTFFEIYFRRTSAFEVCLGVDETQKASRKIIKKQKCERYLP